MCCVREVISIVTLTQETFLKAREYLVIIGMGTNPEPEEVVWFTDGKGEIMEVYVCPAVSSSSVSATRLSRTRSERGS